MKTITVHLSNSVYDLLAEQAAACDETPDTFVADLLSQQVLSGHPYIEIISSRSGPRAVIKGTRIGVDVIIGYNIAGYAATDIATDILPHLSLAQVYDALSYFEDHHAEMTEVLKTNQPDVWRKKLFQEMGSTAASKLLGE